MMFVCPDPQQPSVIIFVYSLMLSQTMENIPSNDSQITTERMCNDLKRRNHSIEVMEHEFSYGFEENSEDSSQTVSNYASSDSVSQDRDPEIDAVQSSTFDCTNVIVAATHENVNQSSIAPMIDAARFRKSKYRFYCFILRLTFLRDSSIIM